MEKSYPQSPSRSNDQSAATEKPFIVRPGYPILFHWLGFIFFAIILLVAAIQHIVPLLILSLLALVLGGIAAYWSRQSLRNLSLDISLSQARVFPGESINIHLSITNKHWIPLSWLQVGWEIPFKLFSGRFGGSPLAKERPVWITSITGGQTIRWKYPLECKVRGDYSVGPVRLRSGDPWDFPREMVLPPTETILVYPRIIALDKLQLPPRELTGERDITRNIYEDTSRLMGVRDYTSSDPLKGIHWKASARRGELQTRLYESTTGLSLFLLFDVQSFCVENDDATFELAITTVASIAYEAFREQYTVGLLANSSPEIRLPMSTGHTQMIKILEALARVKLESQITLLEQVKQTAGNLPSGATLLIVTRSSSATADGLSRQMQRQGYRVRLVAIGSQSIPPIQSDVPASVVQSTADLSDHFHGARR